jgi:hypothetical protein
MRKWSWVGFILGCFVLSACAGVYFTPEPEVKMPGTKSTSVEIMEGFQVDRPYTTLGIIRADALSANTARRLLENQAKEIGADAVIGVNQIKGGMSGWAIKYQ